MNIWVLVFLMIFSGSFIAYLIGFLLADISFNISNNIDIFDISLKKYFLADSLIFIAKMSSSSAIILSVGIYYLYKRH